MDRIAPDRLYVNVPVRPPAESWAASPDTEGLVRAHAILGDAVFIDRPETGEFSTVGFDDPVRAISMIVRRHPMRSDQIADTLHMFEPEAVDSALKQLQADGKIHSVACRGNTYYAAGEGRFAGREEDDGEGERVPSGPR